MNKILKYGLVVVGILLLFVVGILSFYTIAPMPNTGPAQGTISEKDIQKDEIIPNEATSSHDEEEALTNKTTIIIRVDQCLKGSLEDQEIRVRNMGGEDDIVRIDWEDEPSFRENEKVLLYLCEDTYPVTKDIGPKHYVVTGFSLGKFTLTDDGLAIREYEYVNRTELLDSIKKEYEPTIKGIEEM